MRRTQRRFLELAPANRLSLALRRNGALADPGVPGVPGDSLPPPLLRPLLLLESPALFPPLPGRNLRCPREMAPISPHHAGCASDRLPTAPSSLGSSLPDAPLQSIGCPFPSLPDSLRCAQCIPVSAAPR